MRRLAVALAIALAPIAGTARGATFTVVPSTPAPAGADVPNVPSELAVPLGFTTPATQAATISLPELQALWQRAGEAYGIPWEVLAAINKIESNFGRNMGPSSAGAIGWMQFMPSTWLRWGTDADGDGVANPWQAEDAVYSAARYLAAAGGGTDLPRAIFAYNHAQWYVDEVLQLAALYRQGGVETASELDGLQARLDSAESEVVAANEALVPAVERERELAGQEVLLLERMNEAELLSDRLAEQKRAVQVGLAHDAAQAEVERLRLVLGEAEGTLEQARASSQAAAFAPGASSLLAAPSYRSDYVFPVGGGADVVSVARSHHDYPAADIDAPAGSPVYALSDAVVLRASDLPESRCGIAVTLQTRDGLTWTYCHLAYLEDGVAPGLALAAGAPIGLVGSTGHASGPHLHLQLEPATAYPQEMQWFQVFAGSAFRWQDEVEQPILAAASAGSVFTVVPSTPAGETGPVIAFTRQGA